MKILQVNSARSIGGGERHLADLTNKLFERRHEVYAALAPGSPLKRELAALPPQNVLSLRMRNAVDFPSAIKLARFVREQEIDILHAHLARDYSLVAFAAKRAGDVPFVVTRHLLLPLSKIHKITLSRVSRVIAPSEADARALREQHLVAEAKITVCLYGIDTAYFEAVARELDRASYRRNLVPGINSEKELLVGIAGELRQHKGQEDFVRAAAIVAERFPAVHFVIAGEDNTDRREYRQVIEELIRKLNLEKRVHLLGWLEQVAPFYSALDLFVSASRVEPFGLVMVEAMAAGTPVVATATDGASEIIDDKETGRLVPIGDISALALAISELLENARERKRLSEQARAAARLRFSLDRMVSQTEQIYREALGERLSHQRKT